MILTALTLWNNMDPANFLFQWSGVHRDLHSFPTRRSSDLRPWGRRHRRPHLSRRGGILRVDLSRGPARPWSRRTDRKSTRLNSSHVEISYAVFCLKKKKMHLVETDVIGPASTRLRRQ